MPYAVAARRETPSPAGGYAGGWYHAATGYSMPLAVRFAELVAQTSPDRVAAEVASAAAEDGLRRGFARFLNRLLFCLVRTEDRWKIFRRFYSVLPEERIARFYAHRFTFTDAARIIIGRPPAGLAPNQETRLPTNARQTQSTLHCPQHDPAGQDRSQEPKHPQPSWRYRRTFFSWGSHGPIKA
jgi:hypothetical protein